MVDEQKLRELADQLICHPVSRSIEEIESAGEAIKSMLDELQQLRSERTALLVNEQNLEAAVKRARVDALEEARKACVEYEVPTEVLGAHPDYLEGKHMQKAQCAVAIEALKGTP